MGIKDEYQEKLDARLKEITHELERLKARANTLNADVRLQYEKQLADLQGKREHADVKLRELKHAGEGAWSELKSGAEKALDEIGKSAKSAAARFKS